MHIYGAGLAGLIAANAFPTAEIFEAGTRSLSQHKAVLRFRSPAVGDAVGIEFRRVQVNKGIYFDGNFHEPNIQLANLYSQKVIDRLADRSIWNIDAVERYIAPEYFIEELTERCSNRINWNTPISSIGTEPAISTMPMPAMVKLAKKELPIDLAFESAPITVKRWRIPGADVFQTVYFPSPETSLYRASITGDLLIAEYVDDDELEYDFFPAFGIAKAQCIPIEQVNQRYGKIVPIEDNWRKQFIFELSKDHNIFSLGRFGTWRNILLDDVLHDTAVIKRLLNASTYEKFKHLAK